MTRSTEMTLEHETLFKQIVELRRELSYSEQNDSSYFDFSLDVMKYTLLKLETEKQARILIKKFKGE